MIPDDTLIIVYAFTFLYTYDTSYLCSHWIMMPAREYGGTRSLLSVDIYLDHLIRIHIQQLN